MLVFTSWGELGRALENKSRVVRALNVKTNPLSVVGKKRVILRICLRMPIILKVSMIQSSVSDIVRLNLIKASFHEMSVRFSTSHMSPTC